LGGRALAAVLTAFLPTLAILLLPALSHRLITSLLIPSLLSLGLCLFGLALVALALTGGLLPVPILIGLRLRLFALALIALALAGGLLVPIPVRLGLRLLTLALIALALAGGLPVPIPVRLGLRLLLALTLLGRSRLALALVAWCFVLALRRYLPRLAFTTLGAARRSLILRSLILGRPFRLAATTRHLLSGCKHETTQNGGRRSTD
jgi:hypothetical protein